MTIPEATTADSSLLKRIPSSIKAHQVVSPRSLLRSCSTSLLPDAFQCRETLDRLTQGEFGLISTMETCGDTPLKLAVIAKPGINHEGGDHKHPPGLGVLSILLNHGVARVVTTGRYVKHEEFEHAGDSLIVASGLGRGGAS